MIHLLYGAWFTLLAVWIVLKLGRIQRLIKRDIKLGRHAVADLSAVLTEVTEQRGQINSIRTLIEQLKALADQGKIDEIAAVLNDTGGVMDAILANPEPPPTP
jgi:hypothetical protein